MDAIEREYNQAISRAVAYGENDRASELAMGLAEYQGLYKDRDWRSDDDSDDRSGNES